MLFKMSNLKKFMVIFSFYVLKESSVDPVLGYCYNNDTSPYRYYSTKTTYGEAIKYYNDKASLPSPQLEGCTPVVFYILARHGYRYPTEDDFEDILKIQRDVKSSNLGNLCEEDMTAIRNWTMRMTSKDSGRLAKTGYTELLNIGARYKERYPQLMNVSYNDRKVQMIHTEKKEMRTKDSAKAFADGIFGSNENIILTEIPKEKDYLLRFYKICDRYQKEVADVPIEERKIFLYGEEMNNIRQKVQARIGILLPLPEYVLNIYSACIYEYGLYNYSPWCAAFEKEDLLLLEYYEDMEYYWQDMYGHEINYKQSCGLLKDIMQHLGMSRNASHSQYTILGRFGHSGTLNMLYALLGMYKDQVPLRANNYESHKNRKLRTSIHSSMSSNIVFVLHECDDAPMQRVQVLVNERPVDLPGGACVDGICSFDKLKKFWGELTSNCDVPTLCDVKANQMSRLLVDEILVIVAMIFSRYYCRK